MHKAPTIRDVARAAGVGASTVSLALRNDHRLRPAMRERVQKIAQELGYRPNATIANLMAQLRASKTTPFQSTLGFLNASTNSNILQEIPTFQEWVRGATERARELGYGMDFFWLHEPRLTAARLRQILHARGIRGLIVAAIQGNGILPAAYANLWAEFSCTVMGMRPQNPPLHFTANDQFATAYHAVAHLRKLGYRHIGLVIDPDIDAWLEHRFSAGFFAAQNSGVERRLPIFEFHKRDLKAFGDWFRRHRPDALVTLHVEIKDWLQSMDLRAPRDLGLIHLDRESAM
ncbi:MAG: LacI family transcriptional regulator, partial [Verrucomicrobiota bacterium]|nr:LacI family transcriptional regulator [Verrucomicrobiota bacterium]